MTSSIAHHNDSSLYVRQLPFEKHAQAEILTDIHSQLADWRKRAKAIISLPQNFAAGSEDILSRIQLKSLDDISEIIQERIDDQVKGEVSCYDKSYESEFYACYSDQEEKKLEGLMLISYPKKENSLRKLKEKESLLVDALVSHPKNKGIPLLVDEKIVRGSGTALIAKAKDRCRELGLKRIALGDKSGSRPFYEKQGFEVCKDSKSFMEYVLKGRVEPLQEVA